MTYEEAKYWFNHNGADISQEIEMAKVINKALDKQIPKKPKDVDENVAKIVAEIPVCSCGMNLSKEKYPYCQYCGQAIDWSDWSDRDDE